MSRDAPANPAHERLLLQASREILLLLDGASLQVLAANDAALQLLGYAPEALLGQPIGEFECALSDLFFWDEMPDKLEANEVESELRCANGEVLHVLKSVRRVSTEPLRYTLRAVQDASQNRVESDLADMGSRLRATLEATADGILLMDHEGAIVNMNQHFSEMWRLPEALLGVRDDAGILAHVQAQCEQGEALVPTRGLADAVAPGPTPVQVLHLVDGRVIEREVRAATSGKEIIGQVYSFRDVTERYRTQQELIAARDEAKRASAAKSEFLAMMSHEIRTPLNGVLGVAELLAATPLEAGQAEFLRVIQSSGQTLLAILNDILDFSKIEAGKLQLEQTDFALRPLLGDIGALFKYRQREGGPVFSCVVDDAVPPQLRGDPVRLRQILFNLVGNAFKFTEQGQIEVRVGLAADQAEGRLCLRFAVRDSGIGLSPEQQQRLFSSFEQGDKSTTRKYGGTGLGLAICKRLSEMMHGEIGVNSQLGVGSEFWFTACLAPAAGEASHVAAVPAPAQAEAFQLSPQLRVLLVDDHPVNRMLMRGMLKRLGGADPKVAENGQIALDLASEHDFDIVLMDVQMPVMDGTEATRRLRQRGFAGPIIGVSAGAMVEERQAAMDAGVNDYVLKPVNLETLRAALARALQP